MAYKLWHERSLADRNPYFLLAVLLLVGVAGPTSGLSLMGLGFRAFTQGPAEVLQGTVIAKEPGEETRVNRRGERSTWHYMEVTVAFEQNSIQTDVTERVQQHHARFHLDRPATVYVVRGKATLKKPHTGGSSQLMGVGGFLFLAGVLAWFGLAWLIKSGKMKR